MNDLILYFLSLFLNDLLILILFFKNRNHEH